MEGKLDETTTSANIATAPGPFILTKRVPWPFGGPLVPISTVRDKSRKEKKRIPGPFVKAADLAKM